MLSEISHLNKDELLLEVKDLKKYFADPAGNHQKDFRHRQSCGWGEFVCEKR